jgi:hypothetical protein
MQPFCFNPSTNRETLRDFNERVQEFCLEQGAINVVAEAAGKYLILKIATLEDQELPDGVVPEGIPTVMPAVRMLDGKDADWEEQITALMEMEESKASEEDPIREVIDVRVVQNGFDVNKAWAIGIIVTGEIDPQTQDGEDDSGDGDDDGPTAPTGPVLFQPEAARS